jgi:putative glycosyltransferase (exosortase G-associated)
MEIIPAGVNFIILLNKKRKRRREPAPLTFEPEITLIIPVYNSGETLYRCIESVRESDYPVSLINLILSNNESTDDSFQEFVRCQKAFPELVMTWVNAKQGKSKALNLALFNSKSKYIMHIDSDGVLHPDALRNLVTMFEDRLDVDSATGSVMVNPELIDATSGFWKRFLRKLEFFEYCQAFLAGRNFQAEFNAIYTMSGAFSAFRKSAILQTQMFNMETVSEDTHLTFQLRETLGSKVEICDNAMFFVDPIEDLNTLYTQRQRWQRGEMEVIHMFMKAQPPSAKKLLSSFVLRMVLYDHTFAFPRMIWYFALLCLAFLNYPMRLILVSVGLIYLMYVFSGWLYYLNIMLFLKDQKELRRYYAVKWYLVFFLPGFNFLVFWFRFAGIINAVAGKQSWRVMNLQQEKMEIAKVIQSDFHWLIWIGQRMDELLNQESR